MNNFSRSWYLSLKKFWLAALCLLLLLLGVPQLSAAAPPPASNPGQSNVIGPESDPAQGSPPGANLWRDVSETPLRNLPGRQIIPHAYRLVEVDLPALDQLLGQAPLENGLAAQALTELTLPLPDGRLGRFRIVRVAHYGASLAVQYPEIKTYLGWGLDDPRPPPGSHPSRFLHDPISRGYRLY
ncbi:MAG: hypothetical protein U0401_06255 [Anaerolineae bacterium]